MSDTPDEADLPREDVQPVAEEALSLMIEADIQDKAEGEYAEELLGHLIRRLSETMRGYVQQTLVAKTEEIIRQDPSEDAVGVDWIRLVGVLDEDEAERLELLRSELDNANE